MNIIELSNGVGNGMHPYASFLSSPDEAPTSPFKQAGRGERIMKKQWKETDYGKKLRDPRWQKKRLEILQRDEFTCQACMDSESTLNVHHCFYTAGNDPWDYPNNSLVTLCEECHQNETENAASEKKLLIEALSRIGLLASHFGDIATTIYHMNSLSEIGFSNGVSKDVFCSALGWAISTPEMRSLIENKYLDDLSERREKLKIEKECNNG